MSEQRFHVILDPDAEKEYLRLDNSVVGIINDAIDRLEERADEIGIPLFNYQNTKLAGCKEIKLRDAGIRIVFMVSNQVVKVLQVVYILTIERRSHNQVFKIAHKRYEEYKEDPTALLNKGKERPKSRRKQ